MTLLEANARILLEQTASAAPTPGGGSIAALSAAFGVGLLSMSLEVSAARLAKKGLTLTPDPRTELTQLRMRLQELADEDVRVFERYMVALKLPPEQKEAALHEATLAALQVPMSIAYTVLEALKQMTPVLPMVISSVVSDVGAGAAIAEGAARAALLTAQINFSALSLLERQEAERNSAVLLTEVTQISSELQTEVSRLISVRMK